MNVDANDRTVPILDRAQVEALRRVGTHRHGTERADPMTGVWLALVVLGNLIVLAMLVLMVLWS